MHRFRKYSFYALSVLLLVCVSLSVWAKLHGSRAGILEADTQLYASFQNEILDLGAEKLDIGETESVSDAVQKILRFDRGGYWRIRTTSGDVWVYVAYWGVGRQNIREIAFHTPDHCWVSAGWRRQNLNTFDQLDNDRVFMLSKQRCYNTRSGSNVAYVAFWHIFDGKIIDYGNNPVPSNWSLLTSLWSVGIDQRKSQWFIRVHSNIPLVKLKKTEPLKAVSKLIQSIAPGEQVLSIE